MSKKKICSCSPNGTIKFYQDSHGKDLSSPYIQRTQLYGNTYRNHSYQQTENERYNNYQLHLYEKRVFGINACSPQEVSKMSLKEKQHIIMMHKKTQRLINTQKWKATSDIVKQTFVNLFPMLSKSPRNTLHSFLTIDDSMRDSEDLGINTAPLKIIGGREGLINLMMKHKLLPSNFYQLKTA